MGWGIQLNRWHTSEMGNTVGIFIELLIETGERTIKFGITKAVE